MRKGTCFGSKARSFCANHSKYRFRRKPHLFRITESASRLWGVTTLPSQPRSSSLVDGSLQDSDIVQRLTKGPGISEASRRRNVGGLQSTTHINSLRQRLPPLQRHASQCTTRANRKSMEHHIITEAHRLR